MQNIIKYWDSLKEKASHSKAEQFIKDTEQERITQGQTNLIKVSYEQLLSEIDWCVDDTKRKTLMQQLHRLESEIAKSKYSFKIILSYGVISFSKGVKSFTTSID